MKTRRTRFYKAIFLSTHPSGSLFALINRNSHGFERLIDIMLRWNRSKFQRINIKRNSIHVPSQLINHKRFMCVFPKGVYSKDDFDNSVKEFMISQKNFNALLEESLLKIDELARNMDRISLDVDSLKLRSIPPKHDMNESLKSMITSIDECK